MNHGAKAALCRACDAVFDVGGVFGGERPMASPYVRAVRRKPIYCQVNETDERLRIRWSWFRPIWVFIAAVCVGLNLGGIQFVVGSLTGAMSLFCLLPGVLLLGIGLFVAYCTLAGFVNWTVLIVEHGELRIWHGPVPIHGRKTLPADMIDELYCALEGDGGQKNGQSFQLIAMMKNGETSRVLTAIDEIDLVRFVEQKLERRLGIRGRTIEGEYLGDCGAGRGALSADATEG